MQQYALLSVDVVWASKMAELAFGFITNSSSGSAIRVLAYYSSLDYFLPTGVKGWVLKFASLDSRIKCSFWCSCYLPSLLLFSFVYHANFILSVGRMCRPDGDSHWGFDFENPKWCPIWCLLCTLYFVRLRGKGVFQSYLWNLVNFPRWYQFALNCSLPSVLAASGP